MFSSQVYDPKLGTVVAMSYASSSRVPMMFRNNSISSLLHIDYSADVLTHTQLLTNNIVKTFKFNVF